MGFPSDEKPQCGVPRLVSQPRRLEGIRLLIEQEPSGTASENWLVRVGNLTLRPFQH